MGGGVRKARAQSIVFVCLVLSVLLAGVAYAPAQTPSGSQFSDGARYSPPTKVPADYPPTSGAPEIPGFSTTPLPDEPDPPEPPPPTGQPAGEADAGRTEAERLRDQRGVDLQLRAEGAFKRILNADSGVPILPDGRYELTQILSAANAESRSGPLRIRILLDGEQVDSASATCRARDCEVSNRYSLDTISLEAEVPHTLAIETDAAGISTTDLFEFNLPSAQRVGDKPGWVIASQSLSASASAGVNVAFGNLLFSQTDVSLPGPGIGVELTRSFNSFDNDEPKNSPFGRGWVINSGPDIEIRSIEEPANQLDKSVQFVGPSGEIARFINGRAIDGVFTYEADQSGINATLIRQPDDDFELFLVDSRITYVFNEGGRLARQIAPDSEHQLDYEYSGGRLTKITDARGKDFEFRYEEGHVTTILSGSRAWRYGYNQAEDLLTSYTQPDNTRWTYRYDPSKRLTDATDPLGNTTHFDYVPGSDKIDRFWRAYNVTRLIDTRFEYDLGGCAGDRKLSRLTEPLDNQQAEPRRTLFCFDEKGRVDRTTDARGNNSTKNYNGLGNVIDFAGPASATGDIDYANDGHSPRRIAFEGSAASTLEYPTADKTNARFLPTEVQDPQDNEFSLDYSRGQLTDLFTGTGERKDRVAAYDYFPGDGKDRRAGLLRSSTNGAGEKTLYSYNSFGDPERLNPPGAVAPSNYSTNAFGLVDRVIDGSGLQKITREPVFNQPTRVESGGGREVQRAYDADGNLTSQGDALGGQFRRIDFYVYEQRNLLALHSIADGANTRVVETYLYFPNSNLAQIGDLSGITNYAYDLVNLPKTIQAPGDQRPYSFDYQDDYQLKSLRLPNQITQTYGYKDDHLGKISYGGTGGGHVVRSGVTGT